MESENKNKSFLSFLLTPLGVITITIFLILGSLGLLAFGNTQWSRWVYIFQAYHWPKTELGYINKPENFTGRWRDWRRNGQIEFEAYFELGMKNGEEIIWFENGQKKSECNYIDGKLNGIFILWHENGQKESEVQYIKDDQNGKKTAWFENGKKYSEIKYLIGKENGKEIKWHENGQKENESFWLNGEKQGRENWWNEKGELTLINYYKNQEIIKQVYFEKGKRIKERVLDEKTGKMSVTYEKKLIQKNTPSPIPVKPGVLHIRSLQKKR